MLKKIILFLFVLFSLTSCFGVGNDTSNVLSLYETNDFSIFIPSNWEVISDDTNILPKPSTGEVALAVSSKTEIDGFSNNIIVLSENLDSDISSIEYSRLNNVGSKNEYYQYNLISENQIVNEQQENLKTYIFEARYTKSTPMLKFLQTAIVCKNKKGYLLTIGLNKQVINTSRYENIFKSFVCKGE